MSIFGRLAFGFAVMGMISAQVQAQDRGIISQKRAYKGYEKRQRIMPGMSNINVSPSQLHEVYGLEVGGAANYGQSDNTVEGEKNTTRAPGALLSGVYGGDVMVLGLDVAYNTMNTTSDNSALAEFTEDAYMAKPSISLSFTDNITFGLTSALIQNKTTVKEDFFADDTATFNYAVTTAGISYHTSKWEAGVAYSASAKDSDTFEQSNEKAYVYLPSQTAMFVRGNMTDTLSLMGTARYVDYERSTDGSNPAFKKYHNEDHLGTSMTLTYWTPARSSLSLTGRYTPAAQASTIMPESLIVADQTANLYGASIDYVRSFNKNQYVGLTAGFDRGERDETLNGQRFSAQKERLTFGATLNAKI